MKVDSRKDTPLLSLVTLFFLLGKHELVLLSPGRADGPRCSDEKVPCDSPPDTAS